MSAQKEDLRIVRTRKLLSNTLLDMMEEESIEKISVIDLCNKAMVNRATFYAHFEDKYHLLTFALEELKDDLYKKFTKDTKFTTPTETLNSMIMMAVDFFFDKHNHIANIIRFNRNGKVISTIQDSIAHSIKYQLSKYKDTYEIKMPLQILSTFVAGRYDKHGALVRGRPRQIHVRRVYLLCNLPSCRALLCEKIKQILMKDELQNAVRFFIISQKPSSKIYYIVFDFIK